MSAPDIEKLREKKNVSGLIKALKDKNESTRIQAAYALAEINNPKAVAPIIEYIVLPLLNVLSTKDTNFFKRWNTVPIFVNLADVLEGINDPRVIEPMSNALIKTKYDGSCYVDDDYIDLIIPLVRTGFKPKNEMEQVLYLVGTRQWDEIIKIGFPAETVLTRTLKTSDVDILCDAIKTLGIVGGEEAVKELVCYFKIYDHCRIKKGEERAKKAIEEALENIDIVKVARRGDTTRLEELLTKYKNVNHHEEDDSSNDTALMTAAREGHFKAVKLLIDKGADVNISNYNKYTPLMSVSSPEITKLLLEKGADVNAKDRDGFTALIRAAQKGSIEIVKILLEYGADVNVVANYKTALMWAEQKGFKEIVKLLSEKGAKRSEKVPVKELVNKLINGDRREAINAGGQLAELSSYAEIEHVLIELDFTDMLERLRYLKNSGQWHDSDIGLLAVGITERVLTNRGLM